MPGFLPSFHSQGVYDNKRGVLIKIMLNSWTTYFICHCSPTLPISAWNPHHFQGIEKILAKDLHICAQISEIFQGVLEKA